MKTYAIFGAGGSFGIHTALYLLDNADPKKVTFAAPATAGENGDHGGRSFRSSQKERVGGVSFSRWLG